MVFRDRLCNGNGGQDIPEPRTNLFFLPDSVLVVNTLATEG